MNRPLHPLVTALRQAINDRSFVDTDGDVHECPALTVDEIEGVIAKWEASHSNSPAAAPVPDYTCDPLACCECCSPENCGFMKQHDEQIRQQVLDTVIKKFHSAYFFFDEAKFNKTVADIKESLRGEPR